MAVRAYTMAFMTVYQGNDGPPGHPRYPLTAPYSWRAWAEPVHRDMGIRRMMNVVFTDPQMAILRLTRPIVPSAVRLPLSISSRRLTYYSFVRTLRCRSPSLVAFVTTLYEDGDSFLLQLCLWIGLLGGQILTIK